MKKIKYNRRVLSKGGEGERKEEAVVRRIRARRRRRRGRAVERDGRLLWLAGR